MLTVDQWVLRVLALAHEVSDRLLLAASVGAKRIVCNGDELRRLPFLVSWSTRRNGSRSMSASMSAARFRSCACRVRASPDRQEEVEGFRPALQASISDMFFVGKVTNQRNAALLGLSL